LTWPSKVLPSTAEEVALLKAVSKRSKRRNKGDEKRCENPTNVKSIKTREFCVSFLSPVLRGSRKDLGNYGAAYRK
jgi:hypothetical protein